MEEHRDRVAGPQKMVGTGIFPKTPRTGLFRRRAILGTAAARRCRSSGCDQPPSCAATGLAPRGDLRLSQGWRLLASAVPSAASQLSAASSNTLVPPLIRPYPSSPKNISQTPPPPHRRESICEYLVAEMTYRTGRAGDPCAGVRIFCFPKPSVHGFPTSANPADRSCRYFV